MTGKPGTLQYKIFEFMMYYINHPTIAFSASMINMRQPYTYRQLTCSQNFAYLCFLWQTFCCLKNWWLDVCCGRPVMVVENYKRKLFQHLLNDPWPPPVTKLGVVDGSQNVRRIIFLLSPATWHWPWMNRTNLAQGLKGYTKPGVPNS